MTRFLLDANILMRMEDAQGLEALCRAADVVPIVLVEEVYNELTEIVSSDSDIRRGKKRAAKAVLRGSQIQIAEIHPDSLAHGALIALRNGKMSARDLGEAASIALAYSDDTLVFVVGDRNATLSALNELHGTGERVIRPHVFLRRAVEAGAMSMDFVRRFADGGHVNNYGIKPSWWLKWLDGARPEASRGV